MIKYVSILLLCLLANNLDCQGQDRSAQHRLGESAVFLGATFAYNDDGPVGWWGVRNDTLYFVSDKFSSADCEEPNVMPFAHLAPAASSFAFYVRKCAESLPLYKVTVIPQDAAPNGNYRFVQIVEIATGTSDVTHQDRELNVTRMEFLVSPDLGFVEYEIQPATNPLNYFGGW